MQPDLSSSDAERLTTVSAVDPGALFRTVRWQAVTRTDVRGTPSPCPRSHLSNRRRSPSSLTAAGSLGASPSWRA